MNIFTGCKTTLCYALILCLLRFSFSNLIAQHYDVAKIFDQLTPAHLLTSDVNILKLTCQSWESIVSLVKSRLHREMNPELKERLNDDFRSLYVTYSQICSNFEDYKLLIKCLEEKKLMQNYFHCEKFGKTKTIVGCKELETGVPCRLNILRKCRAKLWDMGSQIIYNDIMTRLSNCKCKVYKHQISCNGSFIECDDKDCRIHFLDKLESEQLTVKPPDIPDRTTLRTYKFNYNNNFQPQKPLVRHETINDEASENVKESTSVSGKDQYLASEKSYLYQNSKLDFGTSQEFYYGDGGTRDERNDLSSERHFSTERYYWNAPSGSNKEFDSVERAMVELKLQYDPNAKLYKNFYEHLKNEKDSKSNFDVVFLTDYHSKSHYKGLGNTSPKIVKDDDTANKNSGKESKIQEHQNGTIQDIQERNDKKNTYQTNLPLENINDNSGSNLESNVHFKCSASRVEEKRTVVFLVTLVCYIHINFN